VVGAGDDWGAAGGAEEGADYGIDGKILFRDDARAAKPEQIII
jgi:hypothetical protein